MTLFYSVAMTKSTFPLIPTLSVATTIFVWAAAFPAITLTPKEIDPLPLASVRFAIAASFAVIWLASARPRMMPLADLALCIACGIVSGVGYSVFLNLGQETVSAGAAGFLVKTESLWMAAFAVFLLKERFTAWAWAGMLACVVGVGLIAAAQPGGITLGTGAPLVLAAALCSAAGFTLQRGLALRHGALYVAAVTFIVAALALSPWLPQAATQMQTASTATVAWAIFLGVFPTAIGLACWVYALGYFGVARSGNLLYLVAPLAMLIAWAIAGETPALVTVIGGLLILSGVIVVNSLGRKQAARIDSTDKREAVPVEG